MPSLIRTGSLAGLFMAAAFLLLLQPPPGLEDPYEKYVKTSQDFAPVKQEKEWALKAWPGWVYMPWTWKWSLGYNEEAGNWSLAHGYNGAFLDYGETRVGGWDKLGWIQRFELPFYVDHLAGKGDLHLREEGGEKPWKEKVLSTTLREPPLNGNLRNRLEKHMEKAILPVKASPFRSAYALDDEPSWGCFVRPCMWRISNNPLAFQEWLQEIYGPDQAPEHEGWTGYDALWPKLRSWAVKDFDCSQLMDQWSFNDSWWNNFIGTLVEHANQLDLATPCGFVGAQGPSPFGGYDYAKLMRKVQFLEAYDQGGAQSLTRSFNPDNALPLVTTHFRRVDPAKPLDVTESVWQVWYYLAHGNRGIIGWVEDWFHEATGEPLAWHQALAPHLLEVEKKIGLQVSGAEWIHDGVALYYSHASIQFGWILDAESHRETWGNRYKDFRLGSSHLVRLAWENMLRDEGLQYSFISYADVIQKGIPKAYRVLILPAVLCLSEVEARRIQEFCRRGGTVIADYLPGLWDHHGRGWNKSGILDRMWGLRHDPDMKAGDVFQRRLWVEVDQDANYDWTRWEELLNGNNSCIPHESGFHKAVRSMGVDHVNDFGRGRAVLMNLSPQQYNGLRASGMQAAAKREVFMKHVKAGGVKRWVEIEGATEEVHGYEITYWAQEGRTLLFLCYNPEPRGLSREEGNALKLQNSLHLIRLRFSKAIKDVRDERNGKGLGEGTSFELPWRKNQAVVLSFAGPPPE